MSSFRLGFSQCVLASSALWCLHRSYGYDYASIGLSMYTISNSLGMVSQILGNRCLESWYDETEFCCFTCCLPMFATQICLDGRRFPVWLVFAITFSAPLVHLPIRYIFGNENASLNSINYSHYLCAMAICLDGFMNNQELAYLVAHTFVTSYYVLLPVSIVWAKLKLAIACLTWILYKNNTNTLSITEFFEIVDKNINIVNRALTLYINNIK
ncbi:hypothetical protein O3M35_012599 [Rhynocoris fuscipes]|uniref:Mannosyltransferase n=1 Tax=Rhynocoris fuscipes TaxID=488301 RepID=A0AAW1CUJ2_9HEMI